MPSFLRRLIAIPRTRPLVTNETIALRLPDDGEISVQRVRLTLPMRISLLAADAYNGAFFYQSRVQVV